MEGIMSLAAHSAVSVGIPASPASATPTARARPARRLGADSMVVKVAEVGLAAGAGLGLSSFVLAQAGGEGLPQAGSVGAAVLISVVTAAITAIGTTFFQPWLRTKDLELRVRHLEAQNAALLAKIEEQQRSETTLVDRLARLAEQSVRLNERNLRLAHALLATTERIIPGSAAVAPQDPSAAQDCVAGARVLVVEDEARARESLALMLERVGYAVLTCGSVEEARTLLEVEPFEAVLLDLSLPDGDGVEVLRHVRDLGSPARVVVTTGRDPSQLGPVLALQPFAVFRKPVHFDEWLIPSLRGERVPSSLSPT
jgi:CheY-like chemotaxis protein